MVSWVRGRKSPRNWKNTSPITTIAMIASTRPAILYGGSRMAFTGAVIALHRQVEVRVDAVERQRGEQDHTDDRHQRRPHRAAHGLADADRSAAGEEAVVAVVEHDDDRDDDR